MRALITLLVLAVCANGSVVPDKEFAASLQDAWYRDDFTIAVTNIKSKKNHAAPLVETLLAVKKYSEPRAKLVLILDKRTKRVTIENLDEDGRRNAGHVNVNTISANNPLKSLVLIVHQAEPEARVDVYTDCIFQGTIALKKTFRQLAESEDNPFIEVFREKRCAVKVYRSTVLDDAFRQENCPNNLIELDHLPSLAADSNAGQTAEQRDDEEQHGQSHDSDNTDSPHRHDHRSLHHRQSHSNRPIDNDERGPQSKPRPEREDHYYSRSHTRSSHVTHQHQQSQSRAESDDGRNYYRDTILQPTQSSHDQYPNETGILDDMKPRPPRRGDIGIQSLDEKLCLTDSQIVKTLNELIEATRKLWREVELGRVETQHLRHLIENCAGCHQPIGE